MTIFLQTIQMSQHKEFLVTWCLSGNVVRHEKTT
jgi:hypothetical protein